MNSGTALNTDSLNRIPILVKQLFTSENRLNCIEKMAEEIAKPHATSNLVKYLVQEYNGVLIP